MALVSDSDLGWLIYLHLDITTLEVGELTELLSFFALYSTTLILNDLKSDPESRKRFFCASAPFETDQSASSSTER